MGERGWNFEDWKNRSTKKTRKLWEEVFSDDTRAFLDYYYFIKTKENEIWVIEEDGEIQSMLQLNPYQLQVAEHPFFYAVILLQWPQEHNTEAGVI